MLRPGFRHLSSSRTSYGYAITLAGKRAALVRVLPDGQYSGMWRVEELDGSLSDKVNLSRAIEAAKGRALGIIGGGGVSQIADAAPLVRLNGVPATPVAAGPQNESVGG
jgi:hypothetical protein